jgi:hypothetical protein
VLLSGVLGATLAGCGGDDAPAVRALPKYVSLTELGAATANQQKIDKTATISLNGSLKARTESTITGEGALRYDAEGPAMQLTQKIEAGGGTPTELGLVVLPNTAFVRPPAEGPSALPDGKTWIKIDPDAEDAKSKEFAQLVQAIRDNADPTRSFTQFGDAITVAESAEEALDGVPTMRYVLRVDLAKAAEQQHDPIMKKSLEQSVEGGLATLDYQLWLDASNRLTRVLVSQVLPDDQGEFTLDTRYRDWGKPVQITEPPADEILAR